jgi:hypothetical protein
MALCRWSSASPSFPASAHDIASRESYDKEFWVRLFTLRIVYCLLGLSYRGDPIDGIIIHRFNIRKAKQLLTDIDKQWEKMESRRKIMYYVAKARIAELEHNYGYIDSVLHFLSLAINIGNEGEYGETQFVKLYALHFSITENRII